jgi:hypothetical protein
LNEYLKTASPFAPVVALIETVVPFDFVIVNVTVAPDTKDPAALTVALTVAVWFRVYVAWVAVFVTASVETSEYVAAARLEYDPFAALTLTA